MNNDIRKLIEGNWDDIKELVIEKAEAEQKSKTIWGLETKDSKEYYRIEASGFIESSCFNATYDKYVREVGNAFITREEAEFEIERRKVEAILRKYSRPFRDGEKNCYLYYRHNNIIDTGVVYEINPGIPLFETKEIALKVIEEIGHDRLKKYWFGVIE